MADDPKPYEGVVPTVTCDGSSYEHVVIRKTGPFKCVTPRGSTRCTCRSYQIEWR